MKLKKIALIAVMLITLAILSAFFIHQQQLNQQKKLAEQTTLNFFKAMSEGDASTAFQYVWRAEQFNIKPEASKHYFKDMQVLELINVRSDSAKGRPAYYAQFDQLLLVMLKVKSVYPDDAGSPAGNYIQFVLLAKEKPDSEWLITEIGTGP